MKRLNGHWTALLFGWATLGSAALAGAQPAEPPATEPVEPAGEAAPEVPPAAPAPSAAAPEPPAVPPPLPLSRQEGPSERDHYGGPPLLFGGGKKVKLGAYGALGGAYTRFMGRDSGLVSFEAALLLDHRFSIGLTGYGFTRTPRGPNASDGARQEFGAGYGGLAVRYSLLTKLPIYPTLGVVLGGGAVNLHREHDDDDWDHGWDDGDDVWRRGRFDPFLVVQPELSINANATRWLRFGANVGYRFAGGVGRFGLDNSDLNGVVAGGSLAFGWF